MRPLVASPVVAAAPPGLSILSSSRGSRLPPLSVGVATSDDVEIESMPELGRDGIYHILSEEQHK
jgi:hypothetical protein